MVAVKKWPPLDSVVVLALNTGMRRGEILGLRWEHVDFFRELIDIPQSKSGRSRAIPMNSLVVAELKQLKSLGRSEEFVLASDRTDKHLGWLKRKWVRAVNEAELSNFRFHNLRHTAATRLNDNGVEPFTIAAILGHATIRMTARYTHGTEEGTRRAVDTLVDSEGDCDKSVTRQERQIG